ncbi:MAG TPA: hypothetical protein VGX76_00745, partial [Pirellulales bacterium]|nr:hypothetical protein [Pirellulales bacterium]
MFKLARLLKGIPELAEAPLADLKSIVRRWHDAARPWTSTTFDETWMDFCEGWTKVRFPAGTEPIRQAFDRAAKSTPPDAAANYELPAMRLLIGLCRELQRTAGDAPFFLTDRGAGP